MSGSTNLRHCKRAVKAAAAPVTPEPLATSTGTLAGGRVDVVVDGWWWTAWGFTRLGGRLHARGRGGHTRRHRRPWKNGCRPRITTVATTNSTSTSPARTTGKSPTRDRGAAGGRSPLSEGSSTGRKPANHRWRAQAARAVACRICLRGQRRGPYTRSRTVPTSPGRCGAVVAQTTCNRQVVGSTPTAGSTDLETTGDPLTPSADVTER